MNDGIEDFPQPLHPPSAALDANRLFDFRLLVFLLTSAGMLPGIATNKTCISSQFIFMLRFIFYIN